MPLLPKLNMNVVDVRDVAAAHVNALVVPEAVGHRHIVSARPMWFKEIAQVRRFIATTDSNTLYTIPLPLWRRVVKPRPKRSTNLSILICVFFAGARCRIQTAWVQSANHLLPRHWREVHGFVRQDGQTDHTNAQQGQCLKFCLSRKRRPLRTVRSDPLAFLPGYKSEHEKNDQCSRRDSQGSEIDSH